MLCECEDHSGGEAERERFKEHLLTVGLSDIDETHALRPRAQRTSCYHGVTSHTSEATLISSGMFTSGSFTHAFLADG
jgi:hypothetical protein